MELFSPIVIPHGRVKFHASINKRPCLISSIAFLDIKIRKMLDATGCVVYALKFNATLIRWTKFHLTKTRKTCLFLLSHTKMFVLKEKNSVHYLKFYTCNSWCKLRKMKTRCRRILEYQYHWQQQEMINWVFLERFLASRWRWHYRENICHWSHYTQSCFQYLLWTTWFHNGSNLGKKREKKVSNEREILHTYQEIIDIYPKYQPTNW